MILMIGLVILVLAFGCRRRIVEEYRLLTRSGVEKVMSEGLMAFYIPLTWTERTEAVNNNLQFFKELQNKLPQTLIARYFIDYSGHIEMLEQKVQTRVSMEADKDSSDKVSFTSMGLIQIFSTKTFGTDALLDVADLLDAYASNSSLDLLVVNVEEMDGKIGMTIAPSGEQLNEEQSEGFHKLATDLSQTVFTGKPVNLMVDFCRVEPPQLFHFSSRVEKRVY